MIFGKLATKAENARVYMCIKEVKWDLETANPVRRATVLALATFLRTEMLEASGIPCDVLDRPLDYPRDELMRFYTMMEDIRNAGQLQLKQTQKNHSRLSGENLPEFAVEHAKLTGRGMEVWMSTIGAGISTEKRDDVRAIWSKLLRSFDYLEKAIEGIRQVEKRTADMTGMPPEDGIFWGLNDVSWIENCRFVRSQFVKTLDIELPPSVLPEPNAFGTCDSIEAVGVQLTETIKAIGKVLDGKNFDEFYAYLSASSQCVVNRDTFKTITWTIEDLPHFSFMAKWNEQAANESPSWSFQVIGYPPFKNFILTDNKLSDVSVSVSAPERTSRWQEGASLDAVRLKEYLTGVHNFWDFDQAVGEMTRKS